MTENKVKALFDSGTSRLHFSWWNNGAVNGVIHTLYPDSTDRLKTLLSNLFGETVPYSIVACSVSQNWREPLFSALDSLFPGKLIVVRTPADVGVTVVYDKPETYGIDRVLAAYAAYIEFRDSCVVVDAGSAVTVDAVKSDGSIAGGYIFPGSSMMTETLSTNTGLPQVKIDTGVEGIGSSTETCIRYGITTGYTAAVKKLITTAMVAAGAESRVIITGGGAENLLPVLPVSVIHRPHLVLEGLGLVSDKLPEQT